MDPTSWSAYSQHFSRLGASMNHPPGALAQQAQMNDLALSSSLPRQEHIPGYGNTGGPPHPFLLAASHGLNPSQANHNDPSFNPNLFAANYDASLFSSSFPSANKGHLSSFPQGALFKAVNRENDFNDLRTGFSHCNMAAYGRNSEGNNGLSGTSGLGSGHLFPNSMPPGSWRHSGMIPSSCGPFGVLPHETVLQRSHLVGRGGEKLQGAKQSRSSHPSSSFVEQDLSRGYRSILSSPARPPSSYVDSSNTSHSSLLSPQSDPYFSSVTDNYYSSCSKNDFAAYSSYCSNVQPGVQRSSISPYCYSQTFSNFDAGAEKPDVPTTSTNTSANANFTNFVPNSSLNGNPSHHHNGQISRQSVITSNINNNSSMYSSESHPQNHPYNVREAYPYPPGAAHATSCLPTHPNSRGESNGGRQAIAHMNSSHPNNSHPPTGQNLYPPMSTPIPASTPAHTTPPSSSMGQAYVPTPHPMSHDSGCSVNSQSVMYHSPSNDGCFSTPGTCPSESGSPAKQDLSQHSSPSVYSIESSNLSINSGQFVDSHHVRPHSSSDVNYNIMNGGLTPENASESSKVVEENLPENNTALMASDCRAPPKDMHLPQVLPIDMVKMNKDSTYHNTVDARFDSRQANLVMPSQPHIKHADPSIQTRSECSVNTKGETFSFGNGSPPALDFTAKSKLKCKQGKKRKCDNGPNPLPLNCTYSHLQNNQSPPDTPESIKTPQSSVSIATEKASPAAASDLPAAASASPAPVDLSHSVDLSVKKQDSPVPPENKETKESLPDLNYETDQASGGKWSLTKQDTSESKSKEVIPPAVSENLKTEAPAVKDSPKCESPLSQNPIDDLSSESKKLCNSIEDDLGFLAGLSSDPDVEDSVSKGSFSEKKVKKEKGFLQSFLTFLESSNEPNVTSDSVPIDEKPEKPKKVIKSQSKDEENERQNSTATSESRKNEDTKDAEESGDKDNFDEAPSLDPSLFGCSTLQKEMVVPNPEAPSFSSDEDENSAQGIFDSVAMAIQRLCEDNEEDHSEKGNKSNFSSKGNCSKKDTSAASSVAAAVKEEGDAKDSADSQKTEEMEECTIKRACVMRGRRGKRRRTRHLLVIKVKRPAERVSLPRTNVKEAPKMRRTKTVAQKTQPAKVLPANSRRPLMRKCKEKGLSRKRNRATKRKTRNCVKRKYAFEETEESNSAAVPESKESKLIKDVIADNKMEISESAPAAFVPPPPPPPVTSTVPPLAVVTVPEPSVVLTKPVETPEASRPLTPIRPPPPKKKKVNKTIGYRTRKRRRKPRKQLQVSGGTGQQAVMEVADLLPSSTKETPVSNTISESSEFQQKLPSSSSESCWSTETHFKTGDFVISIDSKNCEKPPIWRIEGKNVLQLFEAQENEKSNSILYRNTSSYSRWSPSSKHKYLKQLVKIIKSDDDTVIVELIKSSEDLADKDFSSSCDYTIHPQRENFEVYLQTLVSHALDPDFIPEIIKEKDEYFLSHLQAIEEVTSQKKSILHQGEKWSVQLSTSIATYPSVNVVASKEESGLCQVCQNCKVQFTVHFQGQPYDPMTLESVLESSKQCLSEINFPLCGLCVQTVTLYSRLHHHKYNFFQEGCKKVKDVKKGEEKDSHTILEECLQDAEWMTQMFQDMLEMWNACDKYR